jgi:hypothetical protein
MEGVMTVWRIAFRVGTKGHEMWPQCLAAGVAAITYDPLENIDLKKYPKYEPKNLWAQLRSHQKPSLARLAYEMKKGDVIYVRQGPKIVCRGKVKGSYKFDRQQRVVDNNGTPWRHQVPVKWETDFPEVSHIWSDHVTVFPLDSQTIRELESSLKQTRQLNKQSEALEGKQTKSEVVFRTRKSALIHAKKLLAKQLNSGYRCEVCDFDFSERYGVLGKDHIIAHHLIPLSSRRKPTITTLDDIALVCDNCHSMLHRHDPPLTLQQLKKVLK